MYKIMVEWNSGQKECIDETDTQEDATYLVNEYRMAFGSSYNRIWFEFNERNF